VHMKQYKKKQMFDVNLVESCSAGSEIADEWVGFHLVLHPDLAAAAN
jgi:RNA polymerase subunit RPABC4/transcription elongation factor Spt4